jgi:cysteine-rich repeat protein
MKKRGWSVALCFGLILLVGIWCERQANGYMQCGNGAIEGVEECDNGERNSDSVPDACRSDCKRPWCGDGVVDSGEKCDDRSGNSDIVPNACRKNCRFPSCGDGIHDVAYGEECDDGNQSESDGCRSDCRTCVQLIGNLFANADTFVCRESYTLPSYPDAGAIIVQNHAVVVDCAGATLQGSGEGAGIFVRHADDVTIRNCTVTGYAAGIRAVNSQRLVIEGNNHLTGNTRGVVLENSTRGDRKAMADTPGIPQATLQGAIPGTPADGGRVAPARMDSQGVKRMRTGVVPKAPIVAGPLPAVAPNAKVVKDGKRVFLDLNVAVTRAEVYAGKRRLGRLPGGTRIEITGHVPNAVQGELILHYFDARGTRTDQTVHVGAGSK